MSRCVVCTLTAGQNDTIVDGRTGHYVAAWRCGGVANRDRAAPRRPERGGPTGIGGAGVGRRAGADRALRGTTGQPRPRRSLDRPRTRRTRGEPMNLQPAREMRRPEHGAGRVRRVVGEELEPFHPRVFVSGLIAGLLPRYVATRLRVAILKTGGWRIGPRTLLADVPRFSGNGPITQRLTIGSDSWINVGCFFELNDTISIGDRVGLAHEVMCLTSTHKLGSAERRAGALTTAPIRIESGAWIGARQHPASRCHGRRGRGGRRRIGRQQGRRGQHPGRGRARRSGREAASVVRRGHGLAPTIDR